MQPRNEAETAVQINGREPSEVAVLVSCLASGEAALVEFHEADEVYCTNICFGGADMRTAFITLSGTGRLIAVDWPRPGLALNDSRTARG